MNRVCVIGAALSAALLAGCNARLDPLDDAAARAGIPDFEFVWAGFEHGPVKVTMPDGEILIGEYRILENGTSQRPLAARAVGEAGTRMECQGFAEYGYHGSGVCQTGRHKYRIVF